MFGVFHPRGSRRDQAGSAGAGWSWVWFCSGGFPPVASPKSAALKKQLGIYAEIRLTEIRCCHIPQSSVTILKKPMNGTN